MTMHDDQLDALLQQAKADYRVPADAPFEAIWARIEHEHFDAPRALAPINGEGRRPLARSRGARTWLRPAVAAAAIAATLVIGVGIGRLTAPASGTMDRAAARTAAGEAVTAAGLGPTAVPVADEAEPLQRATYEYIARTVVLLDSLSGSAGGTALRSDPRFVADAAQLLGTTRLLLDSPAAQDARLRTLLEDLELVLAQVARLRTAPRADELTFIAEAMSERDVVPRLRTVAASYTASGY